MTREEEIENFLQKIGKGIFNAVGFDIGFESGVEWADAHPHWISVEDELSPTDDRGDESDDCIIVDEDGDIYVGYYNRMGNAWFSEGGRLVPHVTHWMPFPKPPKK